MSALSKIAAATATNGGNNIRDGRYKYLVEKCTFNQGGFKGDSFIVEFRVIDSTSSGDVDERGIPTVPNAVGSTCSMVAVLNQSSAAGNAKACMLGILSPLGYTEAQITEQLLLDVSAPANPLRGVCVGNETRRGVNKGTANPANKGKPLTLNTWKPVAQTAQDIAEQRKYLDTVSATADMAVARAPVAVTLDTAVHATIDAIKSNIGTSTGTSLAGASSPGSNLLASLGLGPK